jgi:quinoprotein glucose dehydrogenase
MKRYIMFALALILVFPLVACSQMTGSRPQSVADVYLPEGDRVKVEAWVENLKVPWSLVFLSGERALVSERPGAIRLIKNGKLQQKPYAILPVHHSGEGGLMGLAVHPDFARQPFIYAMYTFRKKDGSLDNRVVQLRDAGDSATVDKVVIEGIPGARLHDGGRLGFGPDGMLYITTGENFQADMAQDMTSLGGKILRVTSDGGVPADNPFKGSPIWSYGHRNPQGLAWQPGTGRLFASEHGPSGEYARFAHDEINVIVKGGNYGWPRIIGAGGDNAYIDPIVVWKQTTPPSGMTFYSGTKLSHLRGDLFVATLKSRALVKIRLEGERAVKIERWFTDENGESRYGRLRDVVQGPDGALYMLTNNTDGRGNPRPGDDRIYRITETRINP